MTATGYIPPPIGQAGDVRDAVAMETVRHSLDDRVELGTALKDERGRAPGERADQLSRRRAKPSLALRLRTFWRAADLDRQLAAGVSPTVSPELGLRAAQLTAPASLAALAATLEAVVDESNAREPTVLILQRGEAVAARAALLRLAERFRDGVVPLAAAAIASQLVHSARSPLFDRAATESAWEVASAAVDLIDRAGRAAA